MFDRYRTLALVVLLAAGCTSVKVRVDQAPAFSLPPSPTVAWVVGPVPAVPKPGAEPVDPFATNTLLDRRVRAAVDSELVRRGFEFVDKSAAALLLNYYVVIEGRVAIRSFSGAHAGVYNHGMVAGVYAPSALRHYEQGVLMLDLIDPRDDELKWRGWAVARLRTETFDSAQVADLVRRILDRLPAD